eukprot:9493520-Pyramimonas_sp.AAC.1
MVRRRARPLAVPPPRGRGGPARPPPPRVEPGRHSLQRHRHDRAHTSPPLPPPHHRHHRTRPIITTDVTSPP